MHLRHLDLVNFRNYEQAHLEPAPSGVTLLRGENGAGKTNLLEAVAYLATLRSFRGSPKDAVVRTGQQQAVLRATSERQGRPVLVEMELNVGGRDKARLNRQPLRRHEDLLGAVLVTIFSPDDIDIVKGPPSARRQFLDDLLVAVHPRHGAEQSELERALRQRNALLRAAGGRLHGNMAPTLDVWDAKLAQAGEVVAVARQELAASLAPDVDTAYRALAQAAGASANPQRAELTLSYQRSWDGPLLEALRQARAEDVRRGATSVGPQRDDLELALGGLSGRLQASQGEQRSMALALRLGSHHLVSRRHTTGPILLLDDVFSELDPVRSAALSQCLPDGQTLVSTAVAVPPQLPVNLAIDVAHGGLGSSAPRDSDESWS